ncbi:trans-aconitate methyltransferase 1 [Spiromyces aspiralis]|uniref:Trans-aconitate methyltransferase 1 n=1 Tax=Spiromyces aspiralis TaxID=68401 RepID=A0ACC1HHB3_9FUNG|nr:trans-aconitate methyltransferase 1 [Spiromyces aspiralis]
MSTYSQSFYNSDNYAAYRPSYSPHLIDRIIEYRARASNRQVTDDNVADLSVVDVACGTGKFTADLSRRFTHVVAVDVSKSMIGSAHQAPNITYKVCPAEKLDLADETVDIVTAATGAHWFDIPAFLAEARRVLKPGGTLAIFGYSGLMHFPRYPQCDELLRTMNYDKERGLADYWDKGREVITNWYGEYVEALTGPADNGNSQELGHVERVIYPSQVFEAAGGRGDSYTKVLELDEGPVVMNPTTTTWRALAQFLRTWSGYTKYCQAQPDKPDIVEDYVKQMMAAAGSTDWDSSFPLVLDETLLLATKT